MVREAMEGAVGRYDALLSAVAPSAAYKFGEKLDDPLAMYKGDLMTVGLNLSGAFQGFEFCVSDRSAKPWKPFGKPWLRRVTRCGVEWLGASVHVVCVHELH